MINDNFDEMAGALAGSNHKINLNPLIDIYHSLDGNDLKSFHCSINDDNGVDKLLTNILSSFIEEVGGKSYLRESMGLCLKFLYIQSRYGEHVDMHVQGIKYRALVA